MSRRSRSETESTTDWNGFGVSIGARCSRTIASSARMRYTRSMVAARSASSTRIAASGSSSAWPMARICARGSPKPRFLMLTWEGDVEAVGVQSQHE